MGRRRGSGRNRDREEIMPRIYYVEFFSIKKKKPVKAEKQKQTNKWNENPFAGRHGGWMTNDRLLLVLGAWTCIL